MKKSQINRIKDKLLDGQFHCTSEFYADYIADPRARLYELQQKGFILESRPCKSHSYHDGPTKEWKIKDAPAKTYPKKVYVGQTVYILNSAQEEATFRTLQAQKATMELVPSNSNQEVWQHLLHLWSH